MRIGEVSELTGIPVETVRYYEKIQLLQNPHRDASGYRRYQKSHLERLQFIRRCRSLDMAQDEIRELIGLAEHPDADCGDVDALLARHLTHVRERLQELSNLEQTLQQLQHACADPGTVRECGILGGLTNELNTSEPDEHHNHVPGTHGQGRS